MKVAAVCPACGRPASSKGRSLCLYCGATLQPVATGQVKAEGSGEPIDVAGDALKPLPRNAVPPETEAPAWARLPVDHTPWWREALSTWRVRLGLLAILVTLAIVFINRWISDRQGGVMTGPPLTSPAHR